MRSLQRRSRNGSIFSCRCRLPIGPSGHGSRKTCQGHTSSAGPWGAPTTSAQHPCPCTGVALPTVAVLPRSRSSRASCVIASLPPSHFLLPLPVLAKQRSIGCLNLRRLTWSRSDVRAAEGCLTPPRVCTPGPPTRADPRLARLCRTPGELLERTPSCWASGAW